jgi:hypothetical protein
MQIDLLAWSDRVILFATQGFEGETILWYYTQPIAESWKLNCTYFAKQLPHDCPKIKKASQFLLTI